MRELYSVTQELMEIFSLSEIQELGDYINEQIQLNKINDMLARYKEWLGDDSEDWIQAVYQYNMADRDNKKQDYTPKCLSKLIAEMIKKPPKSIFDICCGSGSLTLEVYKKYPEAIYTMIELDENVMPYLLFNLLLHNVNATVVNGDVLTGEIFNTYKVCGDITIIENYTIGKYEVCISNPPFNLKNDGNTKFLKYLTDHSTEQGIIILHKPPIKGKNEIALMQQLLDDNKLYRILYNPDRMFISTPTTTSILEIRHNKKDNSLFLQDCTYYHDEYTRHQNGQYGGNSHTGRTYHKQFNYYNDEQIEDIANIWRGPRTLEWVCDHTKAENIPLNLMTMEQPFGFLYGDSEEIQKALEEKQKALEEKQKKEYQEAVMYIARALLAVDLAKDIVRKDILKL